MTPSVTAALAPQHPPAALLAAGWPAPRAAPGGLPTLP